jgi:hypothetical protein
LEGGRVERSSRTAARPRFDAPRGAAYGAQPFEQTFDTADERAMTKRYREQVEVEACAQGAPQWFRWRGSRYRVLSVLGHWREDAGWWAGGGMAVPQRDLWRVEAGTGVYELVHEDTGWRLDRVWD